VSNTDAPMRAMLEYAAPLSENNDLAALRGLLDGIRVDPETKARHLVETSYAESLAGRYRNARTAALMAYTLRPASPDTRQQLAARLRTINEAGLLRELIQGSGPLDRIPVTLLLTYAAQLSYLNMQEAALPYLDEARRADPRYPPTLLSRGQVLTYLGRIDEAAAEFERCIAIAPEIGQAHWFLAHVRKATTDSNHVARLRTQLARPGLPRQEEVSLAFALHKELDDLGEHEPAWQALEQACRAKRAGLRYATSDSVHLVDALMEMPVAEPRQISGGSSSTPVFIVGMHRSGTTLLEQLLDASSDVRGVGELYDFTCAMRYAADRHCRGVIDAGIVARAAKIDFAAVGRRYLDGMAWRLSGERFFTDKLPSNFLNIGFICQALPEAKILHMVRDPMETCFSNLRELFSDANPYSYDQQELAAFFLQYRRLMTHWHARFPGRILDVDYAELTRAPEATMQRVAAFCGLDYVPAMSDPRNSGRAVATASAVQVRQGVVRRETPKWAAYADHLRPLSEALAVAGAGIGDV
jgi:tetratricopeptide (TPR) repeat protein